MLKIIRAIFPMTPSSTPSSSNVEGSSISFPKFSGEQIPDKANSSSALKFAYFQLFSCTSGQNKIRSLIYLPIISGWGDTQCLSMGTVRKSAQLIIHFDRLKKQAFSSAFNTVHAYCTIRASSRLALSFS